MSGSPASSTPTATRGTSRTESPDILRDSSLLHSDESAIVEQKPLQHSETDTEGNCEGEMADKVEKEIKRAENVVDREEEEERLMLRGLSEDRIRRLENRRRGEVESKMDETPMGVGVEEVKTPQSQKNKAKEEKKKKGMSKRTPETVRDTPRKHTLRSVDKNKGESKETEVDSEEESDSAEE